MEKTTINIFNIPIEKAKEKIKKIETKTYDFVDERFIRIHILVLLRDFIREGLTLNESPDSKNTCLIVIPDYAKGDKQLEEELKIATISWEYHWEKEQKNEVEKEFMSSTKNFTIEYHEKGINHPKVRLKLLFNGG